MITHQQRQKDTRQLADQCCPQSARTLRTRLELHWLVHRDLKTTPRWHNRMMNVPTHWPTYPYLTPASKAARIESGKHTSIQGVLRVEKSPVLSN